VLALNTVKMAKKGHICEERIEELSKYNEFDKTVNL
jgi:hypothetical protein